MDHCLNITDLQPPPPPPIFSDCYTFENLTFPPSFIDQCHIPVVSDAGEKQLSVFKYDL